MQQNQDCPVYDGNVHLNGVCMPLYILRANIDLWVFVQELQTEDA